MLIKLGAGGHGCGVARRGRCRSRRRAPPAFFTPDEFALVDELSEMIIPADEHSPGARAAKVAAFIDTRLAEAWDQKDQDRLAGRPHPGRSAVAGIERQAVHAVVAEPSGSAVLTRMAQNETRAAEARGAVLRGAEIARRARVLHVGDRHQAGDGIQGQHLSCRVRRDRRQLIGSQGCILDDNS